MGNSDNKDPEDQYPPEFEYLNEVIAEKQQQLNLINKQIKDMPKTPPDAARLRYHPLALDKAKQDAQNLRSLGNLEHMRDSLQNDIKIRIEAEIRNVDPDVADRIRQVTDEKMNPNPFKGKTDQELDKIKPLEKDLEHSQSFMLTRMKNAREGKETLSSPAPTTSEVKPAMTPDMPDYASDRFSKSLSYNVTVDFSGGNPGKKVEPKKDDVSPGKD